MKSGIRAEKGGFCWLVVIAANFCFPPIRAELLAIYKLVQFLKSVESLVAFDIEYDFAPQIR